MPERQTAGEISLKALSDPTRYDPLEVGEALCDGVWENLVECAEKHHRIMGEDEYCIVLQLVSDPALKNVVRRKFFAWPFLPKPRPNQSVFHYNKQTGKFIRLWVLPDAAPMAALAYMTWVAKPWEKIKGWCDAFFEGRFWEHIRKEAGISMLAVEEFLEMSPSKSKEMERVDDLVNFPAGKSVAGIQPLRRNLTNAIYSRDFKFPQDAKVDVQSTNRSVAL